MRSRLSVVFLDRDDRLRNGWWALAFMAFVAITAVAYRPLSAAFKAAQVPKLWLEPVPVILALLATWLCTRLRRERLASIGLRLDRRWWLESGTGLLLGMAAMSAAAAMIWAVGGVRFQLDPAASVGVLAQGLYVFAFAALLEELLFRGFLFQRLVAGIGAWPTQLSLAVLFAVAHAGNPGMEGVTAVWASIDIGLAAILLGLAYLRTRSLALPFGLHLGWNWAQGYLLGFGVSGFDHTGWLQPVFLDKPQWLTGGTFGPEASVFGVVVDVLMIAVLWRWKGTADAAAPLAEPRALRSQAA